MKIENLYDYLMKKAGSNLVVTFSEGDRYHISDIDFGYSVDRSGAREHEPLAVEFAKCQGTSFKRAQALLDGPLKTPGVSWTSTAPLEPVGAEYRVVDIRQVWDDDGRYAVYHAQS